ncbi:MAG: AtuA-related protein, partial [Rhodobacterales bacterium]
APGAPFNTASMQRPAAPVVSEPGQMDVTLEQLAWVRSGDKGDKANVGVIARKPDYLPYIWAALDDVTLQSRYGHVVKGSIEKFLLPGSHSINFLMHDALAGGGIASLRNDPQAKGFSQLLLDCPVCIPESMAKELK